MKQLLILSVLCIAYMANGYRWQTYIEKHLSVYGVKEIAVDKMSEECRNETDVDTSLFYRMSKRDFPDDRKLKCFFACLAAKLEVIMKDPKSNYLNPDALKDELTETQLEVATDCLKEKVTGKGDKCDEIYAAHICYMLTMDEIKKCDAEQTATPEISTEEASGTTVAPEAV